MELSLSDVFGPGATQTATSITILKADLAGLTPDANNRADSLVAGITNLWAAAYTVEVRAADKNVSLTVLPQARQIFNDQQVINNQLVETSYLNKPFSINMYSLYSSSPPVPNDY